jgi:hypothetical protein
VLGCERQGRGAYAVRQKLGRELSVQAGTGYQEPDWRVDLAARGQREGIGKRAAEGGFVALGEDVAAHLKEIDGLGGQVLDEFFELACDATFLYR